jgi:hypothetical protein
LPPGQIGAQEIPGNGSSNSSRKKAGSRLDDGECARKAFGDFGDNVHDGSARELRALPGKRMRMTLAVSYPPVWARDAKLVFRERR